MTTLDEIEALLGAEHESGPDYLEIPEIRLLIRAVRQLGAAVANTTAFVSDEQWDAFDAIDPDVLALLEEA